MAKGIIDANGNKIEFEPPTPAIDKRGGIYAETVEDTTDMTNVVVGADGKGYVDVQEVGGKLLELSTTDKGSYVGAINELVTALENKANKNYVDKAIEDAIKESFSGIANAEGSEF